MGKSPLPRSPDPSVHLVKAAAGCGKTTDLAARYLAFLAEGIPAEGAIAITFTRKAAAELKERVSLALRACLPDEAGMQARAQLGRAWPRFASVAPSEEPLVRRALAALPEAPIGTTDAFVHQLLTEFALEAALPLPDGRKALLDLPLSAGAGVHGALDRAARRILDPPGGEVDPDVLLLTRYLPLDHLLGEVARRTALDELPLASASEVLSELARPVAAALARLDLAALLGVARPEDEAAWVAALEKCTNPPGRWAIGEVARWLAEGGLPERAPGALCGWLQGVKGTGRSRELRKALEATVHAFGPAELPLWQVIHALRYPYDAPEHVALADTLRAARWRLRKKVLASGLEAAALSGELGYDELLEAAIALCESPPERLRTRFHALLVDEVQDADPRQLRLYRALTAMGTVRGYFVGDRRQSIYLFRGADPEGLRALEPQQQAEPAPVERVINRRSAPRLVLAHQALFGALAPVMRAHHLHPIESLETLEADPENEALALDPALHDPAEPVWIALPPKDPSGRSRASESEQDDRALQAFVQRLMRARSEPGHALDTAAVLAPNWAVATYACQRIREWSGRTDAAFLEGSPGQVGGRVSDDLKLWLRALLDRGDDAAWLGVWKHPSVGLSDAALARIVAGVGVEGPLPRTGRLQGVLGARRLVAPHEEVDILAFERAKEPLQTALHKLGRASTSQILDELTDRLGWRTVLSAGPGGDDDVAELEVLLDWIREHDTDGRPADVILALFDDDRAEKPHVHVDRPAGHIACTTIFQAKGLAWDHVCVLRPGRHARREPAREYDEGWIELMGQRVRLEGLKFDPRGGLLPFRDPLGRLAARIHTVRYTEESARLLYVAITRARRSVTLALAPAPARSSREEPKLPELLSQAWLAEPLPGVAQVEVAVQRQPVRAALGYVRPAGPGWPSRPPLPRPREEHVPSSLGARERLGAIDGAVRARELEELIGRVRSTGGLHLGGGAPLVPPGSDPETGLGLPGHPLGHLGPADWGGIAHAWFARWRFMGEAQASAIEAHLRAEWGHAPAEVVDWLQAICARLAAVGGPLWAWVTTPGVTLRFEHPLLGLGGTAEREALVSGRMDLWLELPTGLRAVVDFKAGGRVPTGWDSLTDPASLAIHAPQLLGYAEALARLGQPVHQVALWFLRTGTSVRWTP